MASRSASPRRVAAQALVAALLDPRQRLDVPQIGACRLFEGWVVKPRAIPEHLVYLVTESTLHGRIGGRRITLEPGMLAWLMPGVLHEFWIDQAARPTPHQLKLVVGPGAGLRLATDLVLVPDAADLRPAFDDAVREAGSALPMARERLRASLAMLLSGTVRLAERGADGPTLDQRAREKLVRFARRRISERVTPAQLARELGLNADYFARVFSRTFGMPPRRWLVRERLAAAAERLRASDVGIAELAAELGYPDVFLFSRQFKQAYGRSPQRFRRVD